ncbi:hypothetical protein GGF31_007133 [Allomyces arbusculus]|nr:hypothetical protein GGF31_007133 [Allomyces arbusculus]
MPAAGAPDSDGPATTTATTAALQSEQHDRAVTDHDPRPPPLRARAMSALPGMLRSLRRSRSRPQSLDQHAGAALATTTTSSSSLTFAPAGAPTTPASSTTGSTNGAPSTPPTVPPLPPRPSLHRPTPPSPSPPLASATPAERDAAITHVMALLPADAPVHDRAAVEQALAATAWRSVDAAVEYLDDWAAAHNGRLYPIDPNATTWLQGMENAGNSCYIDSLVFALFSRSTAMDALLTQDLAVTLAAAAAEENDVSATSSRTSGTAPGPPKPIEQTDRYKHMRAVQVRLTLVINRLRKGHLVTKSEMAALEAAIKHLWSLDGANSGQTNKQEDVSELFLLLTSTFRAPFLPLWQRIYHGGTHDAHDDVKVCTERALQLGIPDPKAKQPIALEKLLADYFFDNKVTHIRRQVPAPPMSTKLRKELERDGRALVQPDAVVSTSSAETDRDGMLVDGWSMMRLLPFLAGENEMGEHSTVPDHAVPIMVPLVLKRYYVKDTATGKAGTPKRIQRRVLIPVEINFDQFTATSSTSALDITRPTFALVLQAVICHLGESPTSGHFISYVNGGPSRMASLQRLLSQLERAYSAGTEPTTPRPSSAATAEFPSAAEEKEALAAAAAAVDAALDAALANPGAHGAEWASAPSDDTRPTKDPPMPDHMHTVRAHDRSRSPPPPHSTPAAPPPYSKAAPNHPRHAPPPALLVVPPPLGIPLQRALTAPGAPSVAGDPTRYLRAATPHIHHHHHHAPPPTPHAMLFGSPASTTAADVATDRSPTWLRFDGLGPTGAKVQSFTSTAAITRQFMDEISKNAYMLFYELRQFDPVPPADVMGTDAVPVELAAALAADTDSLESQMGPPGGRRASAPNLRDQADFVMAMKMQAKEYKPKKGENPCVVM